MAATLRVMHEPGFGLELRRGRFDVIVDGRSVGSVETHESLTAPMEPGLHTLQMRKGRYSSPVRSFRADDEEEITYRCHGSRIWPLYVASLVRPSMAISLVRQPGAAPASDGGDQ